MAVARQPSEIDRDRKLIAAYYLKGKSQVEIAELVDIDQSTVSRDLSYIRQQWRKDSLFDFNEAKGKELAEVDLLELTYWEAWERSLEEFKSKSIKQKGSKIEKTGQDEVTRITPVEAIQKSEDRNGDPRFLQGVQWCIERRCKILGIDAPIKQEHTGAGEKGEILLKVVFDDGINNTPETPAPETT